ncbi:MAG TPA: TAXI family TRAP transporter solute-binding subunit [Stellaceae bacterium]|nr:TAXI family TRAP transporter solute-binding subunit [Stellaceae bacterium]
MPMSGGKRGAIAAALLIMLVLPLGAARASDWLVNRTNRGVVELETGTANSLSPGMAAEIADLLDDGATRRIVTVVGEGSWQNLVDLKALRGIDLAIVQTDALDYARRQNLIPALDTLQYVTRLYNEEFHLLAGRDIKSIEDLAGKKVNFGAQGDGTGVTAARIFSALGIAIKPTNDPTSRALVQLERGQIAALAFVSAKPAPVFRDLDASAGLHFLSIPAKPAITALYAPTQLTAKDYPQLIAPDRPVDTAAVGTVLLAARLTPGSLRYRNLVNFVDAFFTQFQSLLAPGHEAKWHEVNLAADLPGWTRFAPAQQWLRSNAPAPAVATGATPQNIRVMFERFLDERLHATGTVLSQQQKDALYDLFAQFRSWQAGKAH